MAIPGSDLNLVYLSSRAAGYKPILKVLLTQDRLPFGLMKVHLMVAVMGRQFQKSFPAFPDLSYTFIWDKTDAYNQKVFGLAEAVGEFPLWSGPLKMLCKQKFAVRRPRALNLGWTFRDWFLLVFQLKIIWLGTALVTMSNKDVAVGVKSSNPSVLHFLKANAFSADLFVLHLWYFSSCARMKILHM